MLIGVTEAVGMLNRTHRKESDNHNTHKVNQTFSNYSNFFNYSLTSG